MTEVKTYKFIANIIASELSTKYQIKLRNADTNDTCLLSINTDLETYTSEINIIKNKYIEFLQLLQ